jgi:hypothetical protein
VCLAAIAFMPGCGRAQTPPITPERTRALLAALSDDSLLGRATGAPGSLRAARIIAQEMQRAGLEPAGDSGYFQHVPVAMATREIRGRTVTRPLLVAGFEALDTFPPAQRAPAFNVVGVLRGSDPALASEHIMVGAHYDHIGVRTVVDSLGNPLPGDSIFNGADDDASGVVAVLEIARTLAAGPPPRRTIVFAATTGEEVGLLGTRWYIEKPFLRLDQMVADLEIEMIGRPDSLAGGPGKAWLTGYERSTMGDMLAAGGIPIVPDPRPDQRFFERSDNIAYARLGIPAHTLSTFNLHTDYHRPTDEVARTDPDHMAAVIRAALQAVRMLADGPKPEWKEGGRPSAPGR